MTVVVTTVVTHIDEYTAAAPWFVAYVVTTEWLSWAVDLFKAAFDRTWSASATVTRAAFYPLLWTLGVFWSLARQSFAIFFSIALFPWRWLASIWPELQILVLMFSIVATFAVLLGVCVGLIGRFLGAGSSSKSSKSKPSTPTS